MDAKDPSMSSGLLRRTAVDSCGLGNSPEKRKVDSSILSLTTSLTSHDALGLPAEAGGSVALRRWPGVSAGADG